MRCPVRLHVIALVAVLFAAALLMFSTARAGQQGGAPLRGEVLVEHLEARSRAHWDGNQDSAMFYLQWAMEEARRDGSDWLLGRVHLCLGDYCCMVAPTGENGDSVGISSVLRHKMGFEHYGQAHEHIARLGDSELLCSTLKRIIDEANRLGFHGEADRYIALRIDAAKQLDFKTYCEVLIDAASVYTARLDYSKAMDVLMEVLGIYEERSYTVGYGVVYYKIGHIHFKLGNYNVAKDYAYRVLSLPPEEAGDFMVRSACNIMNIIYIVQQEYDSALYYVNRAMVLCNKYNDSLRLVDVLNNRGYVHSCMGSYYEAVKDYNSSIEMAKALRNLGEEEDIGTLNTRNNKASAYLGWGRIFEADQEMEIVKRNLHKVHNPQNLDETYGILAVLAAKKHNYQEAYEYTRLQRAYCDTMYNSEITNSVLELQMRYESRAKGLENDMLKSNLQQLERLKSVVIIVVVLLVVMLTITLLVVWKYKRYTKIVQHKNMLLQRLKDELLEANNRTVQLNTSKDKLFAIIAHDIKNPCTAIVDFCNRFGAAGTSQQEQHELVGIISEALRSLYAMVDNLLQWSRMQMGALNIEPQQLDMGTIVSREAGNLGLNLRKKQIRLNNRVGHLSVYAEENTVSIVVRNLLSNAIKFTPHGGEVSVSSALCNGMAEIVVSDTGVGIAPAENPPNVRIDLAGLKSTAGTDSESGTGLGLSICKELVAKNGGELWAMNRPQGGVQFHFTLPIG